MLAGWEAGGGVVGCTLEALVEGGQKSPTRKDFVNPNTFNRYYFKILCKNMKKDPISIAMEKDRRKKKGKKNF